MQATIQGQQIWYEQAGSEGTPVLLMMGFGMSGRAWAPQVAGLRSGHRIAIYDNRGIGGSEPSHAPYGFETLAEDAVGLLDHLGWRNAHLVGVSMGGMILQHLALAFPSRVRSLAFIATHPGPVYRSLPTLRALRYFLTANTSQGKKRINALERLLYPPEIAASNTGERGSIDTHLDVLSLPADKSALRYQMRGLFRHSFGRKLNVLKDFPTLILHGSKDILIPPRQSHRLHQLIPGSRCVHLSEAGHGVTHQCAAEVNTLLLEHFRNADDLMEEEKPLT